MSDPVRILFVDDEDNILRALRRLFRKEPWHVEFASSGQEALDKFARDGAFDIVVADHRMPGMTGVELLKTLKHRYPRTVRIILSSYTDVDTILDAINEGSAYKFLVKTCSDEVLRQTIEEVVEAVTLRQENRRLAAQVDLQSAEISAIDWLIEELDTQDLDGIAADATLEQWATEALRALPVGLAVLSEDGSVAFANPAARDLLGAVTGAALWPSQVEEKVRAAGARILHRVEFKGPCGQPAQAFMVARD